jgi:hypothetical protein
MSRDQDGSEPGRSGYKWAESCGPRCNRSRAELPAAISHAVAASLLSEFLYGPVNNELGLRIRLFRWLFDWFGHGKSPSRTYNELLAFFANEGGRRRFSKSGVWWLTISIDMRPAQQQTFHNLTHILLNRIRIARFHRTACRTQVEGYVQR